MKKLIIAGTVLSLALSGAVALAADPATTNPALATARQQFLAATKAAREARQTCLAKARTDKSKDEAKVCEQTYRQAMKDAQSAYATAKKAARDARSTARQAAMK